MSNYRLISLLPIFSKIFEKLIYNRLIKFINKNNTLRKSIWLPKNMSTELAVNAVLAKIIQSFEKKEQCFPIFLDFATAFDTVSYKILLKKLEYFTTECNPLRLETPFLK